MVCPSRFAPLCFWMARAVAAVVIGVAAADTGRAQTASPPVWTVPEVGALPDDDHGRLVRRGRDLITATYAHIGPEVPDSAKRFAGNNLACSNCHLARSGWTALPRSPPPRSSSRQRRQPQ